LPPPSSPLFPYTTLFRSQAHEEVVAQAPERVVPAGAELDEGQPGQIGVLLSEQGAHQGLADCYLRRRRCAHGPEYGSRNVVGVRSEEHTSELQSRFDLVC